MRKRFKVDRVCSSDNYILSRKYHVEFLEKEHKTNSVILQKYQEVRITNKGVPHVKCFGKLMRITLKEAESLKGIATIIWVA